MAKNLREKTKRIEETRDRRPKAIAKHVRISPYKVRIVLDLIRNKNAVVALAMLENLPKSAAEPIRKTLLSAIANAEHNLNMSRDDLKVAACYADQGPTLKRGMAVSKGRSHRILKRTSHITVILDMA